jgi:hypothetical protein
MRAAVVLGLSLLVLCNVGCRYRASTKDYAAVRAACRAGNTAKAEKLTLAMLEDDVFRPKFYAAATTAGMSESFGIDYCNAMLLNEVAAVLEQKQ